MPTVSVDKKDLDVKLGPMDEKEFEELCFNFGLELDEITSEFEMIRKEQGEENAKGLSKDIVYKIDVPANRQDLLCVEGLSRALSIYSEKMKIPKFELTSCRNPIVVNVDKENTDKVRPHVVAAVLRKVNFTAARYASFIGLQDKLHQNIGRRRTIVSIGTHDLDTLTPPFTYTARAPADIKFVPLNESREFTAEELMHHYSGESHLKPYLPIIRDSEVYPVIEDSQGIVCSLPPIINGHHSRISLDTTNVFIEVTGTSLEKAKIALDILVAMFSEYCEQPFTVEPVKVCVSGATSGSMYPALSYRTEVLSVDAINRRIGTALKAPEAAILLQRMGLQVRLFPDGGDDAILQVEVPPTRPDILHHCDIAEDVAIAYGYSKIPETDVPSASAHSASLTQRTMLSEALRIEMSRLGFTEALTFTLCSRDDISTKLRRTWLPQVADVAVQIANPKTLECQAVRTTLLCSLLNTVKTSQAMPLPQRIFEVQDVVLRTDAVDVGSRNERRMCAVHYGKTPDFEWFFDVLLNLLNALNAHPLHEVTADSSDSKMRYKFEELVGAGTEEFPEYLPGRAYKLVLIIPESKAEVEIGKVGILHPEVVSNFGIRKGFMSAMEINVEPFV